MNYFYTDTNGIVTGPVSQEELQKMVDDGMVTLDCQACCEGTEDWKMLGDFIRPTEKVKITAKKVSKGRLAGGLEMILDMVGIGFGAIGVIGGVVFFVLAAIAPWVLAPSLIGAGIAVIINGVAIGLVFRAGAEIIRLLKKLCSLPFNGTISAPREVTDFRCSQCNALVSRYDSGCMNCNANFEHDLKPGL